MESATSGLPEQALAAARDLAALTASGADVAGERRDTRDVDSFFFAAVEGQRLCAAPSHLVCIVSGCRQGSKLVQHLMLACPQTVS
jgi:hypothetical protein